MLYASWLFQRVVPPVLSFALGSLGFLTKFDFKSYPETLTNLFRDGITVSLKLRLEGTVMRAQKKPDGVSGDLVEHLVGEECDDNRTHKPDGSHEVLNEIVVDRGPNPSEQTRNPFRPWDVETNHGQRCPHSSSSAMTSTSPPSKQMASVWRLRPAPPPTISLPAVLSVTRTIQSFS